MTWEIEGPQDSPAWLGDYVASIIEDEMPELPPREQRFGSSVVKWWEVTPGQVYIHAEGGSVDDRYLAHRLVEIQMESHGYRRASFDMEMGQWT